MPAISNQRAPRFARAVTAASRLAVAALMLLGAIGPVGSPVAAAQTPDGLVRNGRALAAAEGLERVLSDVIESRGESVVAIAQDRRRRAAGDRPSPIDFDPANLRRANPREPDFVPTYFGSGIVVDRGGLVLTNYHVLGFDDEDYIVDHYVTTADRQVYRARIKGADPRSDLAVLELIVPNDAPGGELDLPAMPLGDGGAVKRGTMVITLGNPYAIARDGQASAGWGIVSNVNRKLPASADADLAAGGKTTLHHYGGVIQTDARLNLGASGGALLNLRGEMIGLTTAVAAQVGYETPAGYAIAVDDVFRRALEALKAGREVEYGFLGVQPVQGDVERIDDRREQGGVRVDRLVRGGPGERAGLRRDDVIMAVNQRAVETADGLVRGVGRFAPDEPVRLSILRDGRASEVVATLTKTRVVGRRVVTERPEPWRGLRVEYPAAMLAPHELVEIPADCVAIRSVADDSPAKSAALAPGMLVTHVGDVAVASPAAFHRATSRASGSVTLAIRAADGVARKIVFGE